MVLSRITDTCFSECCTSTLDPVHWVPLRSCVKGLENVCLRIGLGGGSKGMRSAGSPIGGVTLSLQVHAHIIHSIIETGLSVTLWPC